ncbi:MAG: hypothetical protein GW939_02820 [Candidatus Magasanikbacteria bacterium]|nr:hypothetical protein [Candidatus Magasanikbacteria bacterium]
MLKKLINLKKHHQLVFGLIIMSAMICLWRGIWGLLDIYLIPNDPSLSYLISLILGIAVIITTHYTIDKLV